MRIAPVCIALAQLLAVALASTPYAAHAQGAVAERSREAAEALVRRHYPEGIPQRDARALDAAGVSRLLAMLADPAERDFHANIVMALGLSGDPRAHPALLAYAQSARSRELSGPEVRARLVLPISMGHLAAHDDRALAYLIRRVQPSAEPPRWRDRTLSASRLAGILRRSCVSGLALSGRASAGMALRALAQSTADVTGELAHHVKSSLAMHDRIVRGLPHRIFAPGSLP
ncbi:MAG: hypothetical protein ACE5FG_08705 [Myxococcota bacterium]